MTGKTNIGARARTIEVTLINAPSGTVTVTASNGSKTVTKNTETGTVSIAVPEDGTWVLTASANGETSSIGQVVIKNVQNDSLYFGKIYGAYWDGSSSSAWVRTDDATSFSDPVPYVLNSTTYSSPFDSIMPWSGMVRVTDVNAGELVSIPKFYYKMELTEPGIKIQISETKFPGFMTSPAHADRGDGKGERDIVYIGRYHSASNYKSTSNVLPANSIGMVAARTGTTSVGDGIYLMDYAMLWTIWMLYLVEFSDWNSQAKIGYGCGTANSESRVRTGKTDSMPYHTGTVLSSRTAYGTGVQYRYIEDLWANVLDMVDGIRINDFAVYVTNNPAENSASSGELIGYRISQNNLISDWKKPFNHANVPWALIPASAFTTVAQTYVTDSVSYNDAGTRMSFGGSYMNDSLLYGLFKQDFTFKDTATAVSRGCRLQKLP